MISKYYQGSNYWRKSEFEELFKLINGSIPKKSEEIIFSIDEDVFFERKDSSYWNFMERLFDNENRIKPFTKCFGSIWNNSNIHSVFNFFLTKNFNVPTYIQQNGLEEFGFIEEDEDFEGILLTLKSSITNGFLTSSDKLSPFDGKVHIDIDQILEYTKDLWPKSLREGFRKLDLYSKSIGDIPWNEIKKNQESHIVTNFLFEQFGEVSRSIEDNHLIISGCLESNDGWLKAIQDSTDLILENSDKYLCELLQSCGIDLDNNQTRIWFKNFLDYSIDFDKNKLKSLVV